MIFHWIFEKLSRRAPPPEGDSKLPTFGSTQVCPACGGTKFVRHYDDGWFIDDFIRAPFVWVYCQACGWRRGEQLFKEKTEGENGS